MTVAGFALYFWLEGIRDSEATQAKDELADDLGRVSSEISFELTVITAIFTYAIDDTAKEVITENLSTHLSTFISGYFDRWRHGTRFPDLIESIYLVDRMGAVTSVSRFVFMEKRFVPSTVDEAATIRAISIADTDLSEFRLAMIDESLALVIPLERYQYDRSEIKSEDERKRTIHAGDIVLLIDRDYFAKKMVADLVDSYIGTSGSGPYYSAVVAGESPEISVTLSDRLYPDFSASEFVDGKIDLTTWGGTEGVFFADLLASRDAEPSSAFPTEVLSYRIKDLIIRQWFELSSMRAEDPSKRVRSEAIRDRSESESFEDKSITLYVGHPAGSIDRHFYVIRNRRLAMGYAVLVCFASAAIAYYLLYSRARYLRNREHEFVATVTHELRTPVAAVQVVGDNLAAGVVTDRGRVQSYGEAVLAHGRRLRDIINQILLYAGLSDSNNEPGRDPIQIADAVRRVVSNLPDNEGKRLIAHIEKDLPPAPVDPFALETIVENLLSNALKHTNERSTITLSVYRNVHGRARVNTRRKSQSMVIRVSDTGNGIPRNELSRIKEPFFRGTQSRQNQIPGSGLGLSLVNRIVHTLGGRLTIDSTVGRGTTVTVKLPIAFGKST